ncbi:MAG: hypothetical protein LBH51_10365, partial [Treponema sp.]|nr:hypothetical protein [Treponema sp.]
NPWASNSESPRARFLRGILAALLFLCPLSCSQKEEIRLAPPAMPPLSREEIGYGVVNVSYTHASGEPGGQDSLGYLRRGSVVRILERRVSGAAARNAAGGGAGGQDVWVLVEGGGQGFEGQGWLPESVIDIYSTEAQAGTAAESLLQ